VASRCPWRGLATGQVAHSRLLGCFTAPRPQQQVTFRRLARCSSRLPRDEVFARGGDVRKRVAVNAS
jgi:hypothetical protein